MSEWLELANDLDTRANELLKRGQPLGTRYLSLLVREPGRIASWVAGLPSDAIRKLAKSLSDSGEPDTAIEVAAQIQYSNVEQLGAIREALEVDPSRQVPERALSLAYKMNNPYKKKMAELLIASGESQEAVALAKTINNDKERQYVFWALVELAVRQVGPAQDFTRKLIRELLSTFEDSFRPTLLNRAAELGGPLDWF